MQDISVLYLSQVCIIPGIGHRAHTHDYWHFTLTLPNSSGSSGQASKQPLCNCWPTGSVCPHFINTEVNRSVNVMFLVHDKSLYRKLEQFPFSSLSEEALHIPTLLTILDQARELNPGQDFIDFAFGYYLHLLLATHQYAGNESQAVSLSDKALTFIEKNYMDQIRLEDVAAHIGRSTYHTSHLVKSVTGLTVVEQIRTVRLKNACRLLAYSDIPLDEVVSACGFSSSSYFHRTFREKMGTTPNRYRTSHAVTDTFYEGDEAALDVPYQEPVYTYVPGAHKCIIWKTPREYFYQTVK